MGGLGDFAGRFQETQQNFSDPCNPRNSHLDYSEPEPLGTAKSSESPQISCESRCLRYHVWF